MRLVFDTNVLISAFVFPGGAPEEVYRLAMERRFDLVTSPPLLAEPGRILIDKFGWESQMAELALGQVVRIATVVRPTQRLSVVKDDPSDDRVLEAAAEGGADVIVSGDRHLLDLGSWQSVRIVKPAGFLESWRQGNYGA